MSKYILKRTMQVVNCPKHDRIIPVTGVNVTNKQQTICTRCPEHEKMTCGYVKCRVA
ncbi:MAG: hypothetical protein ACUVX1_12835 [Chloroflexota bacterium]